MLYTTQIFWIFYLFVLAGLQINFKYIKSIRTQNSMLLVSNYIFYGYWDWRFLFLIVIVSLQTFIFGELIFSKNFINRKIFLFFSIFINLIILGYFKYANFFVKEFLSFFNLQDSYSLSKIILPIGISFYIFQSLTYVIDIYLEKINPEKNILNYFTYISFFPQLVAGPIERASSILPQFKNLHSISLKNLYPGVKLIIIGLFLKLFIADNLSYGVDEIFNNINDKNGGDLLLGSISFSIQIYGDFCGYSMISIGVAKIMGFQLMRNFSTPFFSKTIQEFWTRWHISLTTFLNDYVFLPLALNFRNLGRIGIESATVITFIASGLWHGANWTFLLWGFLHGCILIIQKKIPLICNKVFGPITTFTSYCLLNILFRSNSIPDAFLYFSRIFSEFSIPNFYRSSIIFLIYYFLIDLVLEKYGEYEKVWFKKDKIEIMLLSLMLFLVLSTIHPEDNAFIYFQF